MPSTCEPVAALQSDRTMESIASQHPVKSWHVVTQFKTLQPTSAVEENERKNKITKMKRQAIGETNVEIPS